ncbi:class I SAM-dependent methyltransferase [Azospirillum sp. sgz302134]
MDTISWDSVSWEDGKETMEAVCPACGDAAPKPVRLKVRSPWPPNPVQSLVVCAHCGTAAYPTLTQPPYEAVFDPLVACYLEQNAGVDSMARVLSSVEPSKVKRYLELGCGYGLLLDYARTMFGWQVRGFDPGFSAQEGRVTLGVDISHSYLETPADAGPEPHDLVFCSEVIEHVFNPLSLLELLRGVLTDDGTLMLTTPSAGAIHAGTRPGTLLSLLSPGYHFVLFSKEGMETILRRAGFADVRVVDHGHSLQAAASPGRLSVDFDRPYDRRLYRSYLETRIPTLDPKSPLGLGYRYRLLKELTHAGDYAAARGAATQAADAVRLRWEHLDLSDPAALLARLKADPVPQGVEPYHATAPFNLCGILYFHGMLAWQLDGRRDVAALWFEASALAGERMRAALHVIGADDGETEELSWRARAQIPHLLAWDRPAEAADGALRLGDLESPLLGERIPGDILDDVRRKIFVDLVNLGQYAAADRLVVAVENALPAEGAVLASTAFALGILTLNHRKAPRGAAGYFGRAHQACLDLPDRDTAPIVQALLWPSLFHQGQALANAGQRNEAGEALRGILKPAPGLPSVPLDLRARTELLVRTQRLPV